MNARLGKLGSTSLASLAERIWRSPCNRNVPTSSIVAHEEEKKKGQFIYLADLFFFYSAEYVSKPVVRLPSRTLPPKVTLVGV
jgi:hypothetical protein